MTSSPSRDNETTRRSTRIARVTSTRHRRIIAGGAAAVAFVTLAGVAAASALPDQGASAQAAAPAAKAASGALAPRAEAAASRDLTTSRQPLADAPITATPATKATTLPVTQPVRLVATSWKDDKVVKAPATVGALLKSHGVHADSDDRISIEPASSTDRQLGVTMAVDVQKVTVAKVARHTSLGHGSKTILDSARYASKGTYIKTRGHDGVKTVISRVTKLDGKVTSTKKLSTKVAAPATTVYVKGTKKAPVRKPTPAPVTSSAPVSASGAQSIARSMVAARGWSSGQFTCLVSLWNRESGWNVHAENASSGAYGIPQSLPGSKMASAGSDWQTSASTQISWGLSYIAGSYGTPCGALSHSDATGWY